MLMSDSTSNYHALQAFLSKRSGDVTFTAGYTWSKALGDSSAYGDNPENSPDRHYSYGPLSYDRRHSFFASFVWQLPKLTHQNAILRNVAGSWQVSGIVRMQSGNFNTVTANTAIGTRRADYLGGSVLVPEGQRGPTAWINKAAFAPAAASRYGNSGLGIVEGPGLQQFDLSAAKYFQFGESRSLRFQADFFNALNRTNLNPSNLNLVYTNNNFGTVTGAFPARNLQLGLKFYF
jgi:hypothetical protein